MHKYFDIELFGFQHIDKGWWNISLLRIASGRWSWHFFMIEQNRDRLFIEWFTFNRNNG
jgi:hypothetical protein